MKSKWTFSLVFLTIILTLSIFLLGFNNDNYDSPEVVYSVYLDGKIIGKIESKDDFEEYINAKEEAIRKKYEVKTVNAPKGVEIKKTVTYNPKIETSETIYNRIIAVKNFTVKGIVITIDNPQKEDYEAKTINVLNKKIFDKALNSTIKAFVNDEEYEDFMNGTQEEIVNTGSLVENIDLEEEVTYKEELISTEEKIFTDSDELAKYLLYGTTDQQEVYITRSGDTIEDIAYLHKLNVNEFLIANPQFNSVNNLLYESQEVVVGLIDPVISVAVVVHAVEEEKKSYETEIQYDSTQYAGYQAVIREGEEGLYKVTRKYQYVNGQLTGAVVISSTELKPAVNRILIKGEKIAPSVADLSYWAWPTNRPYTISSGYAWRWGSFHGALDITGTGYGSSIYAANNGVVHYVSTGCCAGYGCLGCGGGGGNYVIINHNIGNYYTIYMHMNSVYVTVGQTVARGQRIGTMGNTGSVDPVPTPYCLYCGVHLHFALYIGDPNGGGYYINPYNIY